MPAGLIYPMLTLTYPVGHHPDELRFHREGDKLVISFKDEEDLEFREWLRLDTEVFIRNLRAMETE